MGDNDTPERTRQDSADATGDGGRPHAAGEQGGEAGSTAGEAGLEREVGDIEDADDDDSLPGRLGGGLAGG